ncbi:hypothetical protein [Streptomyces sp. NPDC050287]|uniref:hypothetical protein n=1 Tax=Streptomyces sp. NPDC050287 TaxID=3365608 RepID=UPI0037BA7DDD
MGAAVLVDQAERAGAFRSDFFAGQVIPLPRRLLPFALTRDVDRDLVDPERACQELVSYGAPTVANYRFFLECVAEDQDEEQARKLLRAIMGSPPDQLADLVRAHPELTGDTRVRDAGMEELRSAAGTPVEAALRIRHDLLDGLCGGRVPLGVAVDRYFASLAAFGDDLLARLHAMYVEVRTSDSLEVIPLARDALELAEQLGEEEVETELAARLGERLVVAVRTGLDADLSEALRVLERALVRLPEGSLQWVEVANNLAAAQHLRDDGDRLECWEAARDLLARATTLDRRSHPEFWARIQTNYGLLLAERPSGDSTDLTLGIGHVRAGLRNGPPSAAESTGHTPCSTWDCCCIDAPNQQTCGRRSSATGTPCDTCARVMTPCCGRNCSATWPTCCSPTNLRTRAVPGKRLPPCSSWTPSARASSTPAESPGSWPRPPTSSTGQAASRACGCAAQPWLLHHRTSPHPFTSPSPGKYSTPSPRPRTGPELPTSRRTC